MTLSAILIAAAVGVAVALLSAWLVGRSARRRGVEQADALLREARAEAETTRRSTSVEARETALRAREAAEAETRDRLSEIQKMEQQLGKQEEDIERQMREMESREKELQNGERELVRREQAAEVNAQRAQELVAEAKRKLEKLAGTTPEQARAQIAAQVLQDAKRDAAVEVKRIEDEAAREAAERAQRVIAAAVQRHASEFVHERTVAVVQLPSDDMKGRIIGREGRNIRALEAATGIDLIIDDTPEAVIVSCFNPVRREVARMALQRLIADGRIHPTRIEEVVQKCGEEVEQQCKTAGEQACFDLGIHRANPELVRMLGSLKFRSSFAQNLLLHSIEVAYLAGLVAGEIGANVKLARRAGLFHDIGRAADQEAEGSHAAVGAQVCRKLGEPPQVVKAIACHHGEEPPESILDHIVEAANRLSSQRPGARREAMASYVRRLDDMERLCKSFEGVSKAFAVLMGREVRVLVENERVSDEQAVMLCRDIAKKIESELSYPGQVRISVIRETRAVDYAR